MVGQAPECAWDFWADGRYDAVRRSIIYDRTGFGEVGRVQPQPQTFGLLKEHEEQKRNARSSHSDCEVNDRQLNTPWP